jgi:hypothetical protein
VVLQDGAAQTLFLEIKLLQVRKQQQMLLAAAVQAAGQLEKQQCHCKWHCNQHTCMERGM